MDLKEEIEKRLNSGFSKKEITVFLMDKGFSKEEILNNFPKINPKNALYIFLLACSTILSIGLLVSNIFFATLLSPGGLIVILLCIGTFLMYKKKKAGFVIHMIFYALIILVWLMAFIYYKGDGPDLINFSLWSLVVVMSICSFFIRSLHSLYKKC